jgi:hypothetical protein
MVSVVECSQASYGNVSQGPAQISVGRVGLLIVNTNLGCAVRPGNGEPHGGEGTANSVPTEPV